MDRTTAVYGELGVEAELRGFFEDLPDRLDLATLVISRAGASSIADITVIGRPAILIPYAAATDDHQAANARGPVAAGGAFMIREGELTPELLAGHITAILSDPEGAAAMAQASLAQGRPDATDHLAALVEDLAQTRKAGMNGQTRLPHDIGAIHFTGIGGIGMSGIAEVLLNHGFTVQGSDLKASAITERLAGKGARIFIGQKAENLEGAHVVVISSAIKPGNPELDAARAQNLPVVRRAEMLAELMRLKSNVAVAGTHGKTTTTSMVAALLDGGGMDPTVINGGVIHAYGSNARIGAGEWMVVEADESDGSFVKLPATVAVITNIDPEHLDHYGSFDAIRAAFDAFVSNIPFYGLAVACIDHPEVQALVGRITDRRVATYGLSPQADVQGRNLAFEEGEARFDVALNAEGRVIEGLRLPMTGEHNVSNALAAIAVARHLGIPPAAIKQALAAFGGVNRRFTKVGTWNGVTIIDDYGHHPVEIAAVLRAARQATQGPGDRGAPAAPLHPAARPLHPVLRLLQRRRRGGDRRGLFRRRAADRRHQPRHPGRRAGRPRPPPGAAARRGGGAGRLRPRRVPPGGSAGLPRRRLDQRLGERAAGPAGGERPRGEGRGVRRRPRRKEELLGKRLMKPLLHQGAFTSVGLRVRAGVKGQAARSARSLARPLDRGPTSRKARKKEESGGERVGDAGGAGDADGGPADGGADLAAGRRAGGLAVPAGGRGRPRGVPGGAAAGGAGAAGRGRVEPDRARRRHRGGGDPARARLQRHPHRGRPGHRRRGGARRPRGAAGGGGGHRPQLTCAPSPARSAGRRG